MPKRAEIRLVVDGEERVDYRSILLRHSMIEASSELSLGFGHLPWAKVPRGGHEVELYLRGRRLFAGAADGLRGSNDAAQSVGFSVDCRDHTADADDSSMDPGATVIRGADLEKVCRVALDQVGIDLDYRGSKEFLGTWAWERGATVMSELFRATRARGYIVRSDGARAIIVEQPQAISRYVITTNTGSSIESSQRNRYHECLVVAESDSARGSEYGSAYSTTGRAIDPAIRKSRRLVVIGDREMTPEIAQRRAEWEQAVRAAESEKLVLQQPNWEQQGQDLWEVNTLARVDEPTYGMFSEELLLSEVQFSWTDQEEASTLTLVRRGAFLPEPEVPEESLGGQRS